MSLYMYVVAGDAVNRGNSCNIRVKLYDKTFTVKLSCLTTSD